MSDNQAHTSDLGKDLISSQDIKEPRALKPNAKAKGQNHKNDKQKRMEYIGKRIQKSRDDGRRLKVKGLHPDTTSEELLELFSQQGAPQTCNVDQGKSGGTFKTTTLVYSNRWNAQEAVRIFDQYRLKSYPITVQFAKPRYSTPRHKNIFKKKATATPSLKHGVGKKASKGKKGKRAKKPKK